MTSLLIICLVLLLTILVVLILNLVKTSSIDPTVGNEEIKNLFEEYKNKDDSLLKDEFSRNREEYSRNAKAEREEISNSFKTLADQVFGRIKELSEMQKSQLEVFSNRLEQLTKSNDENFEQLKVRVDNKLKELQEKNELKLEQMRETVDEKLHSTLEKRLGESFKLVSERLDTVHKGLGDMQELARGVGDLKNVLSNVKARGTWGEVQLEKLIEQVLTLDQYSKNEKTKAGSNAVVEFAIKMPGADEGDFVWMPVDAKFPLEDYQRLNDAQSNSDITQIEEATKAIVRRIKQQAKDIQEKYLDPPNTTDFAIMFLPIEGLYAEVLRIPGLFDQIQREFRVTMTGPTNFLALLNSLQMGFRTLAIQKRSSEVWKTLGKVKTEFEKFGDVLDKTQSKLELASKSIGDAKVRTRAIERQLRDVQELPSNDNPIMIEE
ncbi:MAG: DNA recombination protein RmuC [Bacteroidota bacterium]